MLDVVDAPPVDVAATEVVVSTVAALVGTVLVTDADTAPDVVIAVDCCVAVTIVAVSLDDLPAARSIAPADAPLMASICLGNARRVVTWPYCVCMSCSTLFLCLNSCC